MFRRLFLALGLALTLAACGGGGSGELFKAPTVRTSGQITADKAYIYVEVFGQQDAQPETITVDLRAGATRYPMDFEGALICIRDSGSNRPCGSSGTVMTQIPHASGGAFIFDVWNLPSVRALGWNQRLVLEVVIDYSPLVWQYGDYFSVAVTGITYDFDGFSHPVNYIGYSGASVTLVR